MTQPALFSLVISVTLPFSASSSSLGLVLHTINPLFYGVSSASVDLMQVGFIALKTFSLQTCVLSFRRSFEGPFLVVFSPATQPRAMEDQLSTNIH